MSLKLTYTHPSFDKDEEFELTGIGLVQNGKTRTLSEDEERAAVARLGMPVKEAFKGNEQVKIEGTSEVKVSEVDIPEGGGE